MCEPSETLCVRSLCSGSSSSRPPYTQQRGIRSYKFFFTTPNVDRGKTIQRPIAAFSYVSFNSDFFFLHISFHQVSCTAV